LVKLGLLPYLNLYFIDFLFLLNIFKVFG
jgi:hypothetical protein